MSTTYAQTINGNNIYAERSVRDKDGNQIDTTYAKISSLATVASTGDYGDLLNKPTIPTVDQSYNAASTNAQSGTAVANAISAVNAVPSSTSQDEGKVLTVDSHGDASWAVTQSPISAGNGISIANNVVSAKVDGTTISTNASGELEAIVSGTSSKFFTPAYGEAADGSLTTIRLGPTLHTVYPYFDNTGLALDSYSSTNNMPLVGRRPDSRLMNFIQPDGNIVFMYGNSVYNKQWYPVWFPAKIQTSTSGYLQPIDETVYLKSKTMLTFRDQSTVGQYIYNADGTQNTHFSSSNRNAFSVKAPLTTGYNVDTSEYDMIGDWSVITTPPLDKWLLTFWDANRNEFTPLAATTDSNSALAVLWLRSYMDVKLMSGGGIESNIGAGLRLTNPVPDPTSASQGDVLTKTSNGVAWATPAPSGVTDVEVDGTSVVSQGVASITMPTVDQTYNSASSNAQSGVAVASALSGKQDTLTAGSNITISSNTISATDTTYSAGTGIDITSNVISVEAPVDIVAGPGIVIDNPDGNTLRVSVAQAEEVELYGAASGSTTPTLSETLFNFKRCRVTYMGGANIPVETTFDVVSGQNTYDIVGAYFRSDSQNFIQFQCTTMTLSNGGVSATFSNGSRLWLPANSSDTQTIKCTKVVGIHRIAGGN